MAKAHITAYEKAASGEAYNLGGPYVLKSELLSSVASYLNKTGPRFQIPRWVILPVGYANDFIRFGQF